MKQIEVNGMVYEFDEKFLLKQEIRVGDNVQILIKDAYSSRPDLYSGVVTQILPFNENNPAVEVMYIENSYSDFQIKRRIITNSSDESAKIIKTDAGFLPFTKESAIDMLDQNIRKKEQDLREAKEKKEYFVRYFNKYFNAQEEK